MSDFGVFFTCYTEGKAIEYSLEKLYSIYPECPVYLVSDGGNDFSYLEKKHPFLKTTIEDDARGWCQKPGMAEYLINEISPKGSPCIDQKEKEYFDKLYHTGMSWLDRNKAAVEYAQKPYMLMMETDVLVRGKLTMPTDHKLICEPVNYCTSWPKWSTTPNWNDVFKKVSGASAVEVDNYGWPYIYESEAFNNVHKFIKENDDVFRDLVSSHWTVGAAGDVTIPVCFGLLGYEQGNNPESIQCLHHAQWRSSSHPLIHQFRDYYPTKDDNYDGRHSSEG
jgi:hypothetical protein|tara:strand:+ start:8720 stop:9556 length:837 start_codon:yes stop_codon:yes gene_type:complete